MILKKKKILKRINTTIRIVLTIIFCTLNSIINYSYSQNSIRNPDRFIDKSTQIKKASDSLLHKTFDELEISLKKNKHDSILSYLFSNAYLQKAKQEGNIIKIGDGYKFMAEISHKNLVIPYLDSLIQITKHSDHKNYPSQGYIRKGLFYYNNKRYNQALENYIIAHKYAESKNNVFYQVAISHNIALLKKAAGGKKDAVHVFKENLTFIKTQDTINKYLDIYIATLYSITDSYHRMNLPDSAKPYLRKGLNKSMNHSDKYLYTTFLLMSGINNNLTGNYRQALDSLYKACERINDLKKNHINETIIYLQTAKALSKLNQENKAITYLKKIDSLVNVKNYGPEKREAFELLINHYKKLGDTNNQLRVMSKLIHMDTLFNENNVALKTDIVKKYESVQLIKKRDTIIKLLQKEKKTSRIGLIVLIGISIVLLILLFNYYQKQRLYKKRFDYLIKDEKNNLKLKENVQSTIAIQKLELPNEIITEILTKLEHFEDYHEFLDPNIKMNTVAKKLKTNSSYLSRVINVYKKKNFANYVNDLRIDYCIEKLKSDKKFRLYAIKSIGEEAGFNSVQSFSRAFYKKTGIQPSYFLKELDKQVFKVK
ncbi:helix-turn-helix domain-containing protein [Aquimarina algiphila]|uniref:helix-turn-helix domain-containing protein n=1 Tax=Aquimarina algiphila TaxID=2047982 RepID=UPI00232DC9F4|nr:AraC family transcriptional regulator [Aquimarina algiphila]